MSVPWTERGRKAADPLVVAETVEGLRRCWAGAMLVPGNPRREPDLWAPALALTHNLTFSLSLRELAAVALALGAGSRQVRLRSRLEADITRVVVHRPRAPRRERSR